MLHTVIPCADRRRWESTVSVVEDEGRMEMGDCSANLVSSSRHKIRPAEGVVEQRRWTHLAGEKNGRERLQLNCWIQARQRDQMNTLVERDASE